MTAHPIELTNNLRRDISLCCQLHLALAKYPHEMKYLPHEWYAYHLLIVELAYFHRAVLTEGQVQHDVHLLRRKAMEVLPWGSISSAHHL